MINSLGINKPEKKTKVVVAMSGGVDSSVVAGLILLIITYFLSTLIMNSGDEIVAKAVTEEEILEYWGEVDDETFSSIIERMRNNGTEI